jgi:hypothetical protein
MALGHSDGGEEKEILYMHPTDSSVAFAHRIDLCSMFVNERADGHGDVAASV